MSLIVTSAAGCGAKRAVGFSRRVSQQLTVESKTRMRHIGTIRSSSKMSAETFRCIRLLFLFTVVRQIIPFNDELEAIKWKHCVLMYSVV